MKPALPNDLWLPLPPLPAVTIIMLKWYLLPLHPGRTTMPAPSPLSLLHLHNVSNCSECPTSLPRTSGSNYTAYSMAGLKMKRRSLSRTRLNWKPISSGQSRGQFGRDDLESLARSRTFPNGWSESATLRSPKPTKCLTIPYNPLVACLYLSLVDYISLYSKCRYSFSNTNVERGLCFRSLDDVDQ